MRKAKTKTASRSAAAPKYSRKDLTIEVVASEKVSIAEYIDRITTEIQISVPHGDGAILAEQLATELIKHLGAVAPSDKFVAIAGRLVQAVNDAFDTMYTERAG